MKAQTREPLVSAMAAFQVCLLVAVSPAFAEGPAAQPEQTLILTHPPARADGPPALPPDEKPKDDGTKAEEGELFSPRNRHSWNFIFSRGNKRFDAIEWVSRPDLLTLGDLTAWPAERQFDFDWGVNFNVRWWAGPQGDAQTPVPNLPAHVFDLNLRFSWRQQWADGVASEVTLLPGFYSDFGTTPPDAFRFPGLAAGVFRLNPDLHLVLGVQHLQRLHVKVLPIAGLLWEPDGRWQCRLVFPEPKVSYHLDSKADVWVYARGEYGGGAWGYKDDFNRGAQLEYSDLRAAVGFEWGNLSRAICPSIPLGTGFFEVGYIFDRRLSFTRGVPQTGVPPGWMVSFGCTR